MKKLFLAAAFLLFAFGMSSGANADILNPISADNMKISLSTPPTLSSDKLLTDAQGIVNYTGTIEGEAYNFNLHKFVTTTGVTIISYTPYKLELGTALLDANGFETGLNWNVGAYLPASTIPVVKYAQHLYITSGIGAEENNHSRFKFATTLGIGLKLNF